VKSLSGGFLRSELFKKDPMKQVSQSNMKDVFLPLPPLLPLLPLLFQERGVGGDVKKDLSNSR
jgi:hypothetical protein